MEDSDDDDEDEEEDELCWLFGDIDVNDVSSCGCWC